MLQTTSGSTSCVEVTQPPKTPGPERSYSFPKQIQKDFCPCCDESGGPGRTGCPVHGQVQKQELRSTKYTLRHEGSPYYCIRCKSAKYVLYMYHMSYHCIILICIISFSWGPIACCCLVGRCHGLLGRRQGRGRGGHAFVRCRHGRHQF